MRILIGKISVVLLFVLSACGKDSINTNIIYYNDTEYDLELTLYGDYQFNNLVNKISIDARQCRGVQLTHYPDEKIFDMIHSCSMEFSNGTSKKYTYNGQENSDSPLIEQNYMYDRTTNTYFFVVSLCYIE